MINVTTIKGDINSQAAAIYVPDNGENYMEIYIYNSYFQGESRLRDTT